MSYRLHLALGVFCLAACGRTFPASPAGSEPQPVPDLRDSRDELATVSGVTLMPSSDRRHYLTTLATAVQPMPDTGSNQAVIRMTLGFSLVYSRNLLANTRVTGTLDQMSAAADGPFPTSDQLPLPLEFTGRVISGGFFLDSLAGSPVSTVADCQAAELNGITAIQRNILVPPLLLSTGTTWTDSSTVPTCSGSIQLTLTAVRTYTVAGQTIRDGNPVIVVDRRDRMRATGLGAQGQHRISVLSEGSGSARIYLDRATGLLHGSEGTQTVDLIIGSSGRSQHFRQIVEERTRLRP